MYTPTSLEARVDDGTMARGKLTRDLSDDAKALNHIPPRARPGQEVVTIKTEGCVLTLGPQRCYKYDFLNNWPSPLGHLATLTAFFGNPEK